MFVRMVRLLGSDSWRYAKSIEEDRLVDSVGDVVEIEIKGADHAGAVTGRAGHWDHRLEGQLPFVSYVDDAGLEISRRRHPGGASIVNRGMKSELGERDQVLHEVIVDRCDMRTEVGQAVLEGDPPVERRDIRDARRAILTGGGRAEFGGDGERA